MKTLLTHQELKYIAYKNSVEFDRLTISSNELEDKLIDAGFLEDDSVKVALIYSFIVKD